MAAFVILVLSFATLITVHLALVAGLRSRARGGAWIAALLVAPLAPWWGWRERMRARSAVWLVAAVTYAAALTVCMRG